MTDRRRVGRVTTGALVAALGLGAGCKGGAGGGPAEPRTAAGPLDEGVRAPCTIGPSLSLTASDGTGLRLVGLRSRGVVEEPLAFTELRLSFENPEDRVLEGTFSITLPPGAAVSRFAMLIEGTWQEGEVVEKQAAREAYEDFLHRKQDPALLEQAAGNQFSARVFPIPARGRKELILSYSQELGDGESYAVPLHGLPEVDDLDLQAFAAGGAEPARAIRQARAVPPAGFGLARPARPAVALRDGERVLARVRPVAEGGARAEPVSSLLVLFDTSASRALGFGAQVEKLRKLLADVAAREGAGVPVTVLCFDQGVEATFEGTAGGFDGEAVARIKARGAYGASDLEAALVAAGKAAAARKLRRLVVVSDGVPTAGDVVGDRVAAAARALKGAAVERVDALAVGGVRDDAMLAHLARAGLARDGVVVAAEASFGELGRRLRATARSVRLDVEGATWQYPREASGVQPGDEVLVYAELPAGRPVKIAAGAGAVHLPEARTVEGTLLQRGLARAKIASLLDEQKKGGERPDLVKRIVDLSVKHRVSSPYTALLVLEADQDYARFNLDRRALADVLTVDGGRVAVAGRGGPVEPWGAGGPVEVAGGRPPVEAPSSPSRTRQRGAPTVVDCETPEQAAAKLAQEHRAGPGASGDGSSGKKSEAPGEAKPVAEGAASPAVDLGSTSSRRGVAEGVEPPMAPPPPPPLPRAAAPEPRPSPRSVAPAPAGGAAPAEERRARAAQDARVRVGGAAPGRAGPKVEPHTGKFKDVMDLLAAGRATQAVAAALAWCERSPGNVMALVALGAAYEAAGDATAAARAYGSLIDLFPARADLRRFAGARLERVAGGQALPLAVDTFAKAVEQRPDHPSSHRLLAFGLAKRGAYDEAFEAALAGAKRDYPDGRFRGAARVLREDAGLLGAALVRARPQRRGDVVARLRAAGASLEQAPSLRFVLNWETDANDVDFHIYDAEGGHAYFERPALPNGGGELYADVTTGYGPECFTIRRPKGQRSPWYALEAHYFSRGPMGYGMGKLEIIDHDGKGALTFDERPFVIMADNAVVDLGKVGR